MTPELEKFLSSHRLAAYRLQGESAEAAFARYQWNIRLAEALVPAFNYFEVGLRNGLDRALGGLFGTNWLLTQPVGLYLSAGSVDKIEQTKDDFQRIKGRPATHNDVLANMSFGFWAGFFHKRHAPALWNRPKKTYPALFPNLPPAQWNWQRIRGKVFEAKELRNRIAHHEPIWNGNPSALSVHQSCVEMVQAMSREAAQELAKIDRFPEIYTGILQK